MLSGIGPAEHLRKYGINVLQDLHVGDNLQDHVGMTGLTFLIDKPVSIVQNRFQVIFTHNFLFDSSKFDHQAHERLFNSQFPSRHSPVLNQKFKGKKSRN